MNDNKYIVLRRSVLAMLLILFIPPTMSKHYLLISFPIVLMLLFISWITSKRVRLSDNIKQGRTADYEDRSKKARIIDYTIYATSITVYLILLFVKVNC